MMVSKGLELVEPIGSALHRPECVHCTASGHVYASDWRGGVTRISADGRQELLAPRDAGAQLVKTNGFALAPDGSILLTHLDDREGGVWCLTKERDLRPYLLEVEGAALPPTNFVHVDQQERTWITVSTRMVPRTLARRNDVADGYIVLVDKHGGRIVADGLGFTNEAKVDPSGAWLYVNETYGRRTSRYPIRATELGPRETYVEYGHGVFPDGLEFDAEGGLWVTSVFSNRLIRVTADRQQTVIFEDYEPEFVDTVESLLVRGELAVTDLPETPAALVRNLSSCAFGGPDLRTLFLGCVQGTQIFRMRSPVQGAKPVHWDFNF